ncbi:unnamed protein product [Didymodactylos carnosus]|uniref:UDENN domain-containing protein n=1 Tax=Didymodactylos carnosus TaxID=1234261 RepID=A0A813VUK3_9BILA|nr:unnamed protein product [Didymodactylos carnosus]CAF0841648.1 unnamed protein product [Didymodactylos carnosus]CAF3613827.1 unnamed protein product [Didymodactylos carnosus]CAF3629012.1 unnamed protein product [Didymodactylos carnosus]
MSKELPCDPFQHGSCVRESVRSLPKGHFEQIRQMFDSKQRIKHQMAQQENSIKNTININVQSDQSSSHRLQNSFSSADKRRKVSLSSSFASVPEEPVSIDPLKSKQNNVLNLPVTDDEKLKQTNCVLSSSSNTTNIDDLEISESDKRTIEERYRDYLYEYKKFRIKLAHELLQHNQKFPAKKMKPLSPIQSRLKQSISSLTDCSKQLSKDENKHDEKRIKRENNNEQQQQYSTIKVEYDDLNTIPILLPSTSTNKKLDSSHIVLKNSKSLPTNSTSSELFKEHKIPIYYTSLEVGNITKDSMQDSSSLEKQKSGYLSFYQDSSRLVEDNNIKPMASTRQFVSTISRSKSTLNSGGSDDSSSHIDFSPLNKYEPKASTVMLHVKPVLVTKRQMTPPPLLPTTTNGNIYDIVQSNEDYPDGDYMAMKNDSSLRSINSNSRLYSSTSLSAESTSYDSNSSPAPSIKSKYSNSFYNGIDNSASLSSSSSDERTKANKWLLPEQKQDLLNPSKIQSTCYSQCYDTLQIKDINDEVFYDHPLNRTIMKVSNSNLPPKSPLRSRNTRPSQQDISSMSSTSSIISGTGTAIRDRISMLENLATTSTKSGRRNSSSHGEQFRQMKAQTTLRKPSFEIPTTSYVVQTTIFPVSCSPASEVIPTGVGLTSRIIDQQQQQQQQSNKNSQGNNSHGERLEISTPLAISTLDRNLSKKKQLSSTSSTGFIYDSSSHTLSNSVNDLCTLVVEPKIYDIRNSFTASKKVEDYAQKPLPVVSNPVYQPPSLPPQAPKKPPRTFEQNHYEKLSGIVGKTQLASSLSSNSSNSSTASDSPTFDLGARSISCMDLTAGVSNVLTSTGPASFLNSAKLENTYELKTPLSTTSKKKKDFFNEKDDDVVFRSKTKQPSKIITKTTKSGIMKKGISEPNLAISKQSKGTLFSPRNLFDRFKRIVSLSKTSLNTPETPQIGQDGDSDDSISTTDNLDEIRSSRLDHVSRIKNFYDSLGGGHTNSLYVGGGSEHLREQITTLYDYVVLIIPEFGYFENGNGVALTNNGSSHSSSSCVKFKYPIDAKDEPTLGHFCFPEWDSNSTSYTSPLITRLDQNNNNFTSSPLLTKKKFSPEYFRFTLTDMFGQRQHGYCSRFLHKGTVNALCIMSPYDMLEFYFHILSHATDYFLSYKDEDARKFLKEIYPHKTPTRGDSISIQTQTSGLFTLKCEYDRRKELIDSQGLLNLSTGNSELSILTKLINTFICLLYPFSWPHTYVPILPRLMLDICQAPTPYIVGILRSCEYYLNLNQELCNQDILIIDLDNDKVRTVDEYATNINNGTMSSQTDVDQLLKSTRTSTENLSHFQHQILPKMFKIDLKSELQQLRKLKQTISLDECQMRIRQCFMSIFVRSCYNYKDYLTTTSTSNYLTNTTTSQSAIFNFDGFIQSKKQQQSSQLFLEWFTRTQLFEVFIREKFDFVQDNKLYAVTFDESCLEYSRHLKTQQQLQTKQKPKVTVKSVKRKANQKSHNTNNITTKKL